MNGMDFDNMKEEESFRHIEEFTQSSDFTRFFSGDVRGEIYVGLLSERLCSFIGAMTKVVYLSDQTLTKNKKNHPELTIDEYRKIPYCIENPYEVIQDRNNTILIISCAGNMYLAVIKTTLIKARNFLQSFRRTNTEDIERMKRGNCVVIRNENK